jgi:hypothetical protein
MGMQESEKSLKYYFIAVGVLNLWRFWDLPQIFKSSAILGAFSVIGLLLGMGFLYFGFKLEKYLSQAPGFLIKFIILNLSFEIIVLLYYFFGRSETPINSAALLLISLLLAFYLIKNIKRLSVASLE